MPRGGKRPGAGRKVGSATLHTRKIIDEAVEAGLLTPLEYLLRLVRNEQAEPAVRLDAAKSAAPYCHPRLSAIEHSGNADSPIANVHRIERVIIDPAHDAEDSDAEGVSSAPGTEDVQGR